MRPSLPREFVALHKRSRIIAALADLTAEQGYEATKISDVVKRAAVARKTLYDNFTGKEEVFLAAFDAAADGMANRVEEACASVEDDWEGSVEAALAALLGYLSEESAMAWLCLVEAQSATPASIERHEQTMQRFIELARRRLPRQGPLPETVDEAVVGGVAHILSQELRHGRAAGAPNLQSALHQFVVGQYCAPITKGVGKRR